METIGLSNLIDVHVSFVLFVEFFIGSSFLILLVQDGSKIVVSLCNWNSLHLEANSEAPKLVALLLEEDKKILPDFVMFRSFPNDLHAGKYFIFKRVMNILLKYC